MGYLAILVCAIVSMILGFVWYGVIFGKKWVEIIGTDMSNPEARKKMGKSAGPLYALQFLLTLIEVYVLAGLIAWSPNANAVVIALFMYLGFVLPTTAGSCMWNNDSKKVAWTKFFIQAGYQLILFIIFGLILGAWR